MFVVEIFEKYVDQKKHQMVTYIIGKAYDKKFLRRNIKKKKLSDVDRQKKRLFSLGGKKKVCKQKKTLAPPPDIWWCVPYGVGVVFPKSVITKTSAEWHQIPLKLHWRLRQFDCQFTRSPCKLYMRK